MPEASLDLYESSMKQRKGDYTPRSHRTDTSNRKENIESYMGQAQQQAVETVSDEKNFDFSIKNKMLVDEDADEINNEEANPVDRELNNNDSSLDSKHEALERRIKERITVHNTEEDLVINISRNKLSKNISRTEQDVPKITSKHTSNKLLDEYASSPAVLSDTNSRPNDVKTIFVSSDENNTYAGASKFKSKRSNISIYSIIDTKCDFSKFNVQQLGYELSKEYSQTKISKDESFMQRMLFDVFKRQTKEDRIEKLMDRNKLKIDEGDRVQAFNRLIEDANRRLEASDKLDDMKDNLDEWQDPAKKVTKNEWEQIYADRFATYKEKKERKLEEKIIAKEKWLKESEDKIIQNVSNKFKKVSKDKVEGIVKRMYEEAERRVIIKEVRQEEVERIFKSAENADFNANTTSNQNKRGSALVI